MKFANTLVKNYLLDSQFILRLITGDDPKMLIITKNVFEKAKNNELKLILTPIIIAESIYLLTSKTLYNLSRSKIVIAFKIIINQKNIITEEFHVVIETLEIFENTNLDFTDCYLIAKKRVENLENILTFDQKLKKTLENETESDL